MENKIIFLRSQLPKTDSRLQRYIKILSDNNVKFQVIGWDREANTEQNEYILYHKKAKIGGGIKNISNLIFWNIFLLKMLFKNRKTYSYIHAIDFDSIIPAMLIKIFFGKKVIFDIYDKYTDSRGIKAFYGKFIDFIEKQCAIKCNTLILPDECRKKQLGLPENFNTLIVENVPIYEDFLQNYKRDEKYDFVFSYVGILEAKHRGLENLINLAIKYKNIKVQIAGNGALREFIKNTSDLHANIIYFGEVNQNRAFEIMSDSDIIVGMYYKTIKNHYFASPNKYYEHLMLAKPLLTTIGTNPGEKVINFDTGFAIGETFDDLEHFLNNLNLNDCVEKGQKAKKLWNTFYYNYWQNYANQLYLKEIGCE